MKTYLNDFVKYNRTNTVGKYMLFISTVFVVAFTSLGFASGGVTFGWWLSIPTTLVLVTVIHFMVRPVVSKFYAHK